jgi:hypothetical protein
MTALSCTCLSQASHDDSIRAFEAAVHDIPENTLDHFRALAMAHPNPQLILGCCTHWIDAAMEVVGTDLRHGSYLDAKTNQIVDTGAAGWATTIVRAWVDRDVDAFVRTSQEMPFDDGPLTFAMVFDMCVRIRRDDYSLFWMNSDRKGAEG